MNIYLGNLDVADIEKRCGVNFPVELVDYMQPKKQDEAANVKNGMWHCFDIPFVLVCGDMETATEIYKHLQPLSSQIKQPLQISLASQERSK